MSKQISKLFFVGAGNMAHSIIRGIIRARPYSTTQILARDIGLEDFLRVTETSKDDQTYVEATPCPTGREGNVIEMDSKACTLCRLNLKNLDYSDVLILSQYIKRDGSLATFHEAKLCAKQYHKVVRLIRKAQRVNLIKRPPDYLVPGAWHDLNTYLEPDRRRDQPMKVIKKEYWKL